MSTTLKMQISALANQCVRCGLCLPQCPTYQLNPCEAESPRGRIALLAALAADELKLEPTLQQHIDQCLTCRQCETVCPAHVPYESLLIKGRTLIQQQACRKQPLNIFVHCLTHSAKWRRRLWQTYQYAQKSGILYLSKRLGLTRLLKLERLLSYVPHQTTPAFINNGYYPTSQVKRGCVALLLGCASDILEPHTLSDAISLLTTWGFDVHVPLQQTCCGALHAHAGLMTLAQKKAHRNNTILQCAHQQQSFDAMISLTTGCHATWQSSLRLTAPLFDIQDFLLMHWPSDLKLKPLTMTIAVHEPCSQRNSIKQASLSMRLLMSIPTIHLLPFGSNSCCGAAGDYFLTQPSIGDQLGQQSIRDLTSIALTGIASANLGCRLQLAKQLNIKNLSTLHFYHPISLLALALNGTT